MFPPESFNSTREYHAATRGYILNEIFRRVEPSGRTMGEFLRWLQFWLNRHMRNVYLSLFQGGDLWQDGGGHPLWGPRIGAGQGGGPAVVAGRGPPPEHVAQEHGSQDCLQLLGRHESDESDQTHPWQGWAINAKTIYDGLNNSADQYLSIRQQNQDAAITQWIARFPPKSVNFRKTTATLGFLGGGLEIKLGLGAVQRRHRKAVQDGRVAQFRDSRLRQGVGQIGCGHGRQGEGE